MSLNIDLEDVPFAILEAVKERILANRRKLQDSRDQPLRRSTRPRPQFARIGATSKIWRLPKPAAMLEDNDRALIVTWDNSGPVLNDEQATLGFSTGVTARSLTTITVGATVPALGPLNPGVNGSVSAWEYETINYKISEQGDFTFEAWTEITNNLNASGASISLISKNSQVYRPFRIDMGYSDISSPTGRPVFYLYTTSPLTGIEVATPNPASLGLVHLCVMRSNGAFYYMVNGQAVRVESSPEALSLLMPSQTSIYFTLLSGQSPPISKLGQLRLTPDRARYSPAGFTPDPLPFLAE